MPYTTLLRDVFGFDAFRPGQEEIVRVVAEGQNVLAIMPTGSGKSLCFQLPALIRDGVPIKSICPFIAFFTSIPTESILLISLVPSYILVILASLQADSIGVSFENPIPPKI